MKERWKSVVNLEGCYQVSNFGRVRSVSRYLPSRGGRRRMIGRVLKTRAHPFGYPMVTMSVGNRPVSKTVHSLVAEAFIGPCPKGQEVCHEDGDSGNPHLGNLRYGTKTSNEKDKIKHGTYNGGFAHYGAKLRWPQVLEIRDRHSKGASQSQLALEFGVKPVTIHKIVKHKTWKVMP